MRSKWVLRRLAPVITVMVAVVAILMLMLQWGFLCTNIHTLKHISNVCTDHLIGEALGSLCEPLCKQKSMESFSCHPTNRRDGAVFSATWTGKRVLFKTPRKMSLMEYELLHWTDVDADNVKRYPTHDEFLSLIAKLVHAKINLTLSGELISELSHLPGHVSAEDAKKAQAERTLAMDNAWLLLQEDEYLYSVIFAKHNIFPRLVGTCGFLYAIEHVNVIKAASSLFSLEEDDEEWNARLQIALALFEFVKKLDKVQLQLCDVQLKRFGFNGSDMVYLSPGSVRPRKSQPSNRPCKQNRDCDRMDCKTLCSPARGRCDSVVESDNLQLICERIFLGWTAAGRIILPGLLVSQKASSALALLLRRCADPDTSGSSTLREALYHNLARKS